MAVPTARKSRFALVNSVDLFQMKVRTLIQTLMHCDLDSQVVLLVGGKPVDLDRVIQGGRSLTTYLCDLYVGENEEAIDADELDRVPIPNLGQLLKVKAAEERQVEPVVQPPIHKVKPVET